MIPNATRILEHFFQNNEKENVAESFYPDLEDVRCYVCRTKLSLTTVRKNCFPKMPRVMLQKGRKKFYFLCQSCVGKFSEKQLDYLGTWSSFKSDVKLGIIQELIDERN